MTNEELVVDYQKGNEKSYEELVRANEGLICHMKYKWYSLVTNHKLTEDELDAECRFAFWLSVKDYKEGLNCAFSSYAVSKIGWYLSREYMKKEKMQIVSLDDVLPGTEDYTLSDTLADEDAEEDFERIIEESVQKSTRQKLNLFMDAVLSNSEKSVLKLRFGLGCKPLNQRQVAEQIKVSFQRVGQIEKTAIHKLQNSPLKNMFADEYSPHKEENQMKVCHSKSDNQMSLQDALSILNQL